jgi:hypothetical protein
MINTRPAVELRELVCAVAEVPIDMRPALSRAITRFEALTRCFLVGLG